MALATSQTTWEEALRSFLIHLKAVRAPKTVYYYETQLSMLWQWVQQHPISLEKFGKRHLDEYLVYRSETGKSQTTLHHDALCAKVFLKWCQRNDVIDRSLLTDYEIRSAPKTHKYMPTEEDMRTLLTAIFDYWNPVKNSDAKFHTLARRNFHRDRNYAVVLMLLDTACRIGEVLSLKLDDYQAGQRQITVTESKGREPRSIPLSEECVEAVGEWMKVRKRLLANVPAEEDEKWLFLSEYGGKVEEGRFLKTLKKFTRYAGLSDNITLHSLRRYSINKLAKTNLLAAQAIAGHKDTKTTLIYTKIDPDFVRDVHAEVGVIGGIVERKETVKKKRLL